MIKKMGFAVLAFTLMSATGQAATYDCNIKVTTSESGTVSKRSTRAEIVISDLELAKVRHFQIGVASITINPLRRNAKYGEIEIQNGKNGFLNGHFGHSAINGFEPFGIRIGADSFDVSELSVDESAAKYSMRCQLTGP